MTVKCSACGHVFNRQDLKPGASVQCRDGATGHLIASNTNERTDT